MGPSPMAFQAPLLLSPFPGPTPATSSTRAPHIQCEPHQVRSRRVLAPHAAPRRAAPPTCSLQTDWRRLTPQLFDAKLATDALPLCLVGMSNCGKSHWSRQFHERRAFALTCVDELIERAIEPELSALGYSGIDGLAAWMGFPTDERFDRNQKRYLELEESITSSAPAGPGNVVLDTTGSVCYLTGHTLERLRTEYLVVHLEANDDMLDVMTDSYFETPKPVVWGNSFDRQHGETPEQALRRCYPRLLRERRQRYASLAHITVPASVSLSRELELDGFVNMLKTQMR